MRNEKIRLTPIYQLNTVDIQPDNKDAVRKEYDTFLDIRMVTSASIFKPDWVKEDDSRTYMEIWLLNGYYHIGVFNNPEAAEEFIGFWALWVNASKITITTVANSHTPSA